MMTLLNQVKEMVNPYLRDGMMEMGFNSFSVDEGNISVDVECEHYVDFEIELTMNVVISPRKVLAYVCDKDGNYGEPVDMTNEFNDYKYKVYC